MALIRSGSIFSSTIFDDLQSLDEASKLELISKLWPESGLTSKAFIEDDYTAFIGYIGREFSKLRGHQHKFASNTLDTTLELIEFIRTTSDQPQTAVLQKARERFQGVDEAAVLRSLELAARLWLTINLHSSSIAVGPIQPSVGAVEWPQCLSLNDTVRKAFTYLGRVRETASDENELSGYRNLAFTAASLNKRSGIRFFWTDNLTDHLYFDKQRRTLTVYQHKICLLNHRKDPRSPILQAVLLETIDTLNLLFPVGHESTRELLRREDKMSLLGLGHCDRPHLVDLEDYRVWKAQLADLVEVFNEPPRNLSQLLSDNRNVKDLTNIWIGLLVLVLTVVTLAFGTISSVYGIKQYELSLAQACLMQDAAKLLPKFCK